MPITPKCSVVVLLLVFAGFCVSDVSALNCLSGSNVLGQPVSSVSVAAGTDNVCVAYSIRCTSGDSACTDTQVQDGVIKQIATVVSSSTAATLDTYPYSALYWAFCKCSGPDNCNVQANNCGGSPKTGLFCRYGNSQFNVSSWAGSDVCVSYSQTCATGNTKCTSSMIGSAAKITILESMSQLAADSYAQMPPAGVTNFCKCATTDCNTGLNVGGTCGGATPSPGNTKSGSSRASSNWTLVAVVSAMLVIMQVV
jgi:hypothetical protein